LKKDALYWGIVAVFFSFVLMVFWLVYDVWKTGKEKRRAQAVPSIVSTEMITPRDYSELWIVEDDKGKKMVWISEGPFPMGSPEAEGDPDEFPPRVTYLSGFFIDLYEVTGKEFQEFVKGTGFPPAVVPVFQDDLSRITDPDLPVVGVSWDQVKAYCEWSGKRLPTEAEWEKAARGEQTLKWPWGGLSGKELGNVVGEQDGFKYSAPPGSFELGRSPYGVYDMGGNVAEWVQDWYDPAYYAVAPFQDPKGPEKGKHRVYRGGSWNDSLANIRTAKRFAAAPHQASAAIGFRCAKDGTKDGKGAGESD
jgi:formylglycine-generating enzyme